MMADGGSAPLLAVDGLDAFHGDAQALWGLSFGAAPGAITCLVGRNGAGKTTTLRALLGLVRRRGEISFGGARLDGMAAEAIPRLGIGYAPQGRRLFGEMTVAENLEIGLMARGSGPDVRERALARFPRLRERLRQRAGTLSGGERQMLAMARALCVDPTLLLLDEPTEGLQPSMVAAIRDIVAGLRAEGVAILLVEQRLEAIQALADAAVVIENGRIVETMAGDGLGADLGRLERYLGVG